MFVDIHSHIIPGMDDGAKHMDIAIKMLKAAAADGTAHIVMTPHFTSIANQECKEAMPDYSSCIASDIIREKTAELMELAAKHHINIKIYPGMEVLLQPDTPLLLEAGIVAAINGSRYVLVEFPAREIPLYAAEILYGIQLRGYVPILAHPERYIPVIRDKGILTDFIDLGALVQVNAGSLTGLFGRRVKKTAMRLIRKGMVHFVASDAHSCNNRTTELSKAARVVKRKFGKAVAQRLLYENGMTVLNNGTIRG